MAAITAAPTTTIRTWEVRDELVFDSWQFLYFFPLPQGQGSFRPVLAMGHLLSGRALYRSGNPPASCRRLVWSTSLCTLIRRPHAQIALVLDCCLMCCGPCSTDEDNARYLPRGRRGWERHPLCGPRWRVDPDRHGQRWPGSRARRRSHHGGRQGCWPQSDRSSDHDALSRRPLRGDGKRCRTDSNSRLHRSRFQCAAESGDRRIPAEGLPRPVREVSSYCCEAG